MVPHFDLVGVNLAILVRIGGCRRMRAMTYWNLQETVLERPDKMDGWAVDVTL